MILCPRCPWPTSFLEKAAILSRCSTNPPTGSPVVVERAFLQYLVFTNFGRTPITSGDLASVDPLRVQVTGGSVLDISLANVTREVCGIQLGKLVARAPTTNGDQDVASAPIELEFLDHRDGGLIQILTDAGGCEVSLHGTVVGMPQGITRAKAAPASRSVEGLECGIFVTTQILALVCVPFLYRWMTGSWQNVLLLLLPVAAMVVPLALFILVEFALLGSRGQLRFPELLSPSGWYVERRLMYHRLPRSDRIRQRELEDSDAEH
jgi:hypothetical protein